MHRESLAHENIYHNYSPHCFPPTIRISIPFQGCFFFQEYLQHSNTAIIDESRNMLYVIIVA